MNRDEFEAEYVRRHMGYDPRCEQSKLLSVIRARVDYGYSDSHMDLCWKVQDIQNEKRANVKSTRFKHLRW
jgi:hypothetical protein